MIDKETYSPTNKQIEEYNKKKEPSFTVYYIVMAVMFVSMVIYTEMDNKKFITDYQYTCDTKGC